MAAVSSAVSSALRACLCVVPFCACVFGCFSSSARGLCVFTTAVSTTYYTVLETIALLHAIDAWKSVTVTSVALLATLMQLSDPIALDLQELAGSLIVDESDRSLLIYNDLLG